MHDFEIPELGKVAPYGVYDIAANTGWVNLGIDHDTAAFAVESIRRWWRGLGRQRYPAATRLLITADCGGSNGARVRLWKRELQSFANQSGLSITVTHHPPASAANVCLTVYCFVVFAYLAAEPVRELARAAARVPASLAHGWRF